MEPPESSPPQPPLPEGEGKEEVKEADELKLGVAKDTATETSDVESPMATQRRLTEGEGELEVAEHHKGDRMTTESLIGSLKKYYALDVESPMANQRQLVSFFHNFRKKVVRGCLLCRPGEEEKSHKTSAAMMSSAAMRSSTESPSELDCVNINLAQTSSDAPPYAESSTAVERRVAEGEAEIRVERHITDQSLYQEQDRIFKRARSLVKNVKEKCSIHKVHSGLRVESAKHYEPVLVSIGPYHHGKPPVQDMEKFKVYYMEVLLHRVREKSSDRYKEALKDKRGEPRALDCYRDTFRMKTDSFAKSMVLDGCFMIELFRRNENPSEYRDSDYDILFNIRWVKPRLERDMLLFENQIPLLVLRALFSLTEPTTEDGHFVPLVLKFFEFNGKPIPYDAYLTNRQDDIPHLLGLVYEALVPCKKEAALISSEKKDRILGGNKKALLSRGKEVLGSREEEEDLELGPPVLSNRKRKSMRWIMWTVLVRLIEKTFRLKTAQQLNKERKSCEFIRTAVALEQVGVTFDKVEDYNVTFHDIKFCSGVLSIPRLVIDDNTESLFRNLVAYEQYSVRNRLHRVVDYLHVMDCLINTAKDVEVLRHCGIIDNRIGDDKKVSTMFNRLCSGVYFNQDEFFHKDMFDLVNEFCMDRKNAWKATLKNVYFGSPWSIISFVAAVLLLLFTATQTVYSVLSYYHRSSS